MIVTDENYNKPIKLLEEDLYPTYIELIAPVYADSFTAGAPFYCSDGIQLRLDIKSNVYEKESLKAHIKILCDNLLKHFD